MCHDGHTASLATFLYHDIQPRDGHRLILAFLTTMDRLRLSENALKVSWTTATITLRSRSSPRLTYPWQQEGPGLLLDQCLLEYLRVGNDLMLRVLDLASRGWSEGLLRPLTFLT